MKSNATAQLYGYSLQFPRALLRLLEVGEGGAVGIEVVGDVSVFFPNESILTEEDKSSLTTNPLTDKSEKLWKTLFQLDFRSGTRAIPSWVVNHDIFDRSCVFY